MAAAGGLRALLWLWLALAAGAVAALGKRSSVKVLTDGMWRELLQGEWMVEFYAPWCPACQNLQPEWENFAEWGEDLEVNIAKVDVTEQPGLSGRFVITALPTIYQLILMPLCGKYIRKIVIFLWNDNLKPAKIPEILVVKIIGKCFGCKDGEFRRYQGARTKTDFINFISDQEWKSIEPVSSWFGPSSFLMSSMSALFQLSMWIRHCHGYLTENVGIPVWGSYAIFALATLFLGLILGLTMVFLADCICPSKRHRPPQYPYSRKLAPESAQLLKKLDEEQEADEEDNSDDDTEGKEVSREDSSPNTVRQRPVNPAAAVDKS